MIAWFLIVLPLFAFLLTSINLLVWPRGHATHSDAPISVLIPARNEAANIERCVRSAALNPNVAQIVVYEDRSTDDTRDILERLQEHIPILEIVDGVPLPDGWIGKPHACHQLAKHADHPTMLFIDADVSLYADGVARLLGIQTNYDTPVVTAVPRQDVQSWFERLVLPMLHVTYLAWLPLPLIWRTDDPRFLAANGQIILVQKEIYDAIGGFESVKDAVVDDMAFCAQAKQANHRVVFADGFKIASCRMYGSASDVWRGFSKNIFEGVGSLVGLAFVIAVYLTTFVFPYLALAMSPMVPELLVPSSVAVGLNVGIRLLLIVRFRHPVEGALLHPISVLALIAIAINSAKWHFTDQIVWAGRVYSKRSKR